jgi:hypothetical protein
MPTLITATLILSGCLEEARFYCIEGLCKLETALALHNTRGGCDAGCWVKVLDHQGLGTLKLRATSTVVCRKLQSLLKFNMLSVFTSGRAAPVRN